MINVDIEKCFDKIQHAILLDILKEYLDQATLELANKLLKAGYVEIQDLNDRTRIPAVGVPQGSIISPLFCNIYLNKLDVYIAQKLLPIYNKGDKRTHNKEYLRRAYLNVEEQAILKA